MSHDTRSSPRAFTLLEVMLATVIIALGVLGLTALFAGAAKQQVDTARRNEAVKLGQAVEGALRGRMGPISRSFTNGAPTNIGNALNAGQYETASNHGLDIPLVETVWYPLSAYPPKTNVPDWPAFSTAFEPTTTVDLGNPLRLFMTVPGQVEVVLYENRLNPQGLGNPTPRPTYGPAPTATGAARAVHFIDGPMQGGAEAFYSVANNPPGRDIARLPHGRIAPGSLRVRFEIATQEFTGGVARGAVLSRRTVVFDDADFYNEPQTSADDADLAGLVENFGAGPFQPINGHEGLLSTDGTSFLQFNRLLTPPAGINPLTNAFISEFLVYLASAEWVERIVVERYAYRSDRLLTLDERVRTNPDGKTATGAAILLQRARGGAPRTATLLYSAEPMGGPFPATNPPRFLPPESGPANDRLLRRVSLELHADQSNGSVYVLPRNQTNPPTFVLEQGDLLLIAGDPTNAGLPGNTSGFPGADDFVRISRNDLRDIGGGEYRCYLDVAPRSAGRGLVAVTGNEVPSLPATIDVEGWALNTLVESLQDYSPTPSAQARRVKWKITPLDGRTLGGE